MKPLEPLPEFPPQIEYTKGGMSRLERNIGHNRHVVNHLIKRLQLYESILCLIGVFTFILTIEVWFQ